MINPRERFVVGDWIVDPATGTLSGSLGQKRLPPKLTDLLVALARRAGQVATRDELLREVWGARGAVSDEPLTRAVAELRRILGDGRAEPAYIETIPKRGYRVVAPVSAVEAPAPAPLAAAPVAPLQVTAPPAPPAPPAEALVVEPGAAAVSPRATDPSAARPRAALTRRRLAALGAATAAALALVATFALRTPPPRPAGAISVAVLPFADLSPTADRQYFADGVQEEVIARLARIAALRVTSRATVDAYRNADEVPARDIARELGVGAVIEGTVRYSDERVRVTARLVEAATDTHLWAETFDRPLTLENLFDIQADIADQVAAGLTRSLAVGGSAAVPMPTASLAAYEAFLLGKYHYRRHQPGDIQIAIEQFQRAVDADTSFADAWDWLAYAWNAAGVDLGWTTPARAFPRARAAALRALELNPKLATSSALLGFLRATYDWEWQAALAELEQAVAAAPQETGTVWSYAFVLSLQGRHDEAIAAVRALAEAFPSDGRLDLQLAGRLIDAGRYTEAIEAANAALRGGAEQGQVREILGIAAFGAGDLPAAVTELERAVALQQGAAAAVGRLAAAYASVGRADEARALLAELAARGASEQQNVATLARGHAALGELDRAFALLEQGVEQRQRDVLGVAVDPFFVTLRDDARLAPLIERMGVAAPAGGSH